jgi:glucose-6-phosphate 1-dehydrogenase
MADDTQVFGSTGIENTGVNPPGAPCVYVIIGACGDVTKRLMMPAVYNLVCDGLLPEPFAVVGADMPEIDTNEFRARFNDPNEGIKKFHTRKQFDEKAWAWLNSRLYYTSVKDPVNGYKNLAELVKKLQAEYKTGDNILFYFAVPPKAFAPISANI